MKTESPRLSGGKRPPVPAKPAVSPGQRPAVMPKPTVDLYRLSRVNLEGTEEVVEALDQIDDYGGAISIIGALRPSFIFLTKKFSIPLQVTVDSTVAFSLLEVQRVESLLWSRKS